MRLPDSFEVADRAAIAARTSTRRVYAVELGALVVAALAGITAWHVGAGRLDVVAGVGTLAFVVAVVCVFYRDARHPQADWVRARAAAESISAAAWRYAVGGDPFALPDLDADTAFLRHVKVVLTTVDDMPLPHGAPDVHDITADMRALRAGRLDDRKAGYLAGRLDDQIGFYDRRTRSNDGARRNWFVIGVVANLAGLTGGLLRFLDVVHVDVVGVAAAIAGAAVAWTQLNQHRTLATTYAQTRQQLVGARDRLASVGEQDWAEYVDSVEDVMTREHSIWLTKRATPGIPR